MRKELRGAALPGADVSCSGQKKEAGRVRWYRTRGCLASMRRSQGDGGLGNDCPRFLALNRIHDLVPVIDPITAQSEFCEIPGDYSPARETHSDCLGFAAVFWL